MRKNLAKIIGIFLIAFSCCHIPTTHAFVDEHNKHKAHEENDFSQSDSCPSGEVDLISKAVIKKEKNSVKIIPNLPFETQVESNLEIREKIIKNIQNTYIDLNISRLKRE